ncbi:MAG TPA: TonB-dependent receptor [Woeseiaceae bacterium]|nr:TonB-dependent receptor [Woeseiaceae bacterium]
MATRALVCMSAFAAAPAGAAESLFDRSIEELGQLRVTSVSRRSEPLHRAASSIYVITAEDIRRSGYDSIPEVLRLAPGVEVARDGTHSWTISIRGFNSDLSNKLLVLIDGRSVYSPLFAGVFWDAQDTLLEDIERIEVISGPGGTLWGANAVNGVINIITRAAEETEGTLVDLEAGDEDRFGFGLRHGFDIGADAAARAYVKYTDRDPSALPTGGDGVDDVSMAQAGFRVDWESDPRSQYTVQGDVYAAENGAMIRGDFTLGTLPGPDTPGHVDIAGHNLLGRWTRTLDDGADVQLQVYFDHTSRDIPGSFNEDRDTVDVDFQHDFFLGKRHDIVWGAGFRWTSDDLDNTLFATFEPASRSDTTLSFFVQDEIALWGDRASLILGTKLQDNDYTGFEVQPNIRASWRVTDGQVLWAAISRAVRIPARLNTDLQLTAPIDIGVGIPLYVLVSGNDAYESEELVATELGWRAGLTEDFSLDVALFYNQYDKLQTQEVAGPITPVGDPPEYLTLSATLENGMEGDTYGGTVVANWQPAAWWKLQFQYAYLDMDLELREGFTNTDSLAIAGNSPEQQAAVYAWLELPRNLELYAGVRYTDELPSLDVPDYTSVSLSLGWQPNEHLRAALTGRNLTDDTHLEFGGGNLIERSISLSATVMF